MRTIEELRSHLLQQLAGTAIRPSMYGGNEWGVELVFRYLLEDLCFIDEKDDQLKSAWADLQTRKVFTAFGVRGGIRRCFPGIQDAHHEVTSIYSEVAYRLELLQVERLLSDAEWEFLTDGLKEACQDRDFTLSEVLAKFGTPTMSNTIRHDGSICYGPASIDSRWVVFDFCRCYFMIANEQGKDPYKADPLLRNVRIPAPTLAQEITLTPHGRTCPDVVGRRSENADE